MTDSVITEPQDGSNRILVVEDNAINTKVVTETLKRLGYQSDIAADGLEAIEAVSSGVVYKAILMDCHMPNMNGFETTKAIRAMSGEVSKTPIVAMTASAMVGDREQCMAAGMDDYLSKPLRKELLRQTLEKWTDAKQ